MIVDYQLLTTEVILLSRRVGGFIREQRQVFQFSYVEEKGLHDLVSYVDRQAEQMLIEGLQALLPESGFIAEESGTKPGNKYCWIVDPLDGTTNFVHGVPVFAISIALQYLDQTVVGLVYEINLDECFYAFQGGKAMLNGVEISVSKAASLDKSLLATGFPYYDFTRLKPYMGLFAELVETSRGMRRLGSAAVDLAYVACGRFEAFYEYGLHPWDVAAGAFIVTQAGGRLSDFNGGKEVVFGKEILATNGLVHDEFLVRTAKYFGK
ncbi:MAG: inositol monophosphatase [Bacteroidetes bacterium]|nr:inositol monophosphatase [Bacteroidota bacterium]